MIRYTIVCVLLIFAIRVLATSINTQFTIPFIVFANGEGMIYLPDAKMIDPVTGVQSNNDGVILQYQLNTSNYVKEYSKTKTKIKKNAFKQITIFPADRILLERLQKAKLSELTEKITLKSVRE